MIAFRKPVPPEIREKMTVSILETLSHLPEKQKKIFVWKHYCGWPIEKIAEMLKCSISEVDHALQSVQLLLSKKAGSFLT